MSECDCEALTVSCHGKKRRNLKAVKWEDVDFVYVGLSANQLGCMGIFQFP
jgi:hypothetical protein